MASLDVAEAFIGYALYTSTLWTLWLGRASDYEGSFIADALIEWCCYLLHNICPCYLKDYGLRGNLYIQYLLGGLEGEGERFM